MTGHNERLRGLCEQVSQEQQAERLTVRVQELNDELQRLSGKKEPIVRR